MQKTFIEEYQRLIELQYVPKIERCLEHLNEESIWWRPNPQVNSVGNLILHLSGNIRHWVVSGIAGEISQRNRDAEFSPNVKMFRDELVSTLRLAISDSKNVIMSLDPVDLLEKRMIRGRNVTIFYALMHVTEHFGMHTGQIIQLTKIITKEDLMFYDFTSGKPVENWHKSFVSKESQY
jgi:uncharacterized damage-inducible protein DinB